MALQNPKTNKTIQQFLAELEDLTRRNRGGFYTEAEETGSNVPFIVPGMQRKQILPGASQRRSQGELEQPLAYAAPDVSQYQYPQQQQMGLIDFLEQAGQMNQPDVVASSVDGGVITGSGETIYKDGSIKTVNGNIVKSIASLPNGMDLYDDGSVRYSGLDALIQDIFGQDRPITQEYGNYNPSLEPGSGYNLGTDIRTKDLQKRTYGLPTEVRVVQVLQDDGTRWGERSGHQGYGNSILVQLPDGQMMRFSHLANVPGFKEGDVIPAGTEFIAPGATGNVTGEHLDLEYYDQSGQIADPQQYFSRNLASGSAGSVVNPQEIPPEVQRTVQMYQQQQEQFNKPEYTPEPTQPTMQPQQIAQRPQILEKAADVIEEVQPTKTDFGVSEMLRGQSGVEARRKSALEQEQMNQPRGLFGKARQVAGNFVEAVGDAIPFIPEGYISEAIAGGKTKHTGMAFAAPEVAEQGQKAMEDIQKYQAGAGIKPLFSSVSGMFSKPDMVTTPDNRTVGAFKGESLLPSGTYEESARPRNDIRDPFFRFGQSKNYSQYLQPGSEETGALNTDIFSEQFYSDPKNIAEVFGGTHLADVATNKFKEQFRKKYSDPMYDQTDVQNILKEMGTITGDYTPNIREPKLAPLPSDDMIKPGDINPQTGRAYAVNPATGNWDDNYFGSTYGSGQVSSIGQAQQQGRTSGTGVQNLRQESGRTISAPQGQSIRVDSGGEAQLVDTGKIPGTKFDFSQSPTKTISAQPAQQQMGLFSKISNIFRKFFN